MYTSKYVLIIYDYRIWATPKVWKVRLFGHWSVQCNDIYNVLYSYRNQNQKQSWKRNIALSKLNQNPSCIWKSGV